MSIGVLMGSINVDVSIHVLRRGRCVWFRSFHKFTCTKCFNPRPPKRTLCHESFLGSAADIQFQSTSSEEDVVSVYVWYKGLKVKVFQSTSSEEDVVSDAIVDSTLSPNEFQSTSSEEDVVSQLLMHHLAIMLFQSTSSEEDVVSNFMRAGGPQRSCFNPRPPKRTLCPDGTRRTISLLVVSIHVLRKGRCVYT